MSKLQGKVLSGIPYGSETALSSFLTDRDIYDVSRVSKVERERTDGIYKTCHAMTRSGSTCLKKLRDHDIPSCAAYCNLHGRKVMQELINALRHSMKGLQVMWLSLKIPLDEMTSLDYKFIITSLDDKGYGRGGMALVQSHGYAHPKWNEYLLNLANGLQVASDEDMNELKFALENVGMLKVTLDPSKSMAHHLWNAIIEHGHEFKSIEMYMYTNTHHNPIQHGQIAHAIELVLNTWFQMMPDSQQIELHVKKMTDVQEPLTLQLIHDKRVKINKMF